MYKSQIKSHTHVVLYKLFTQNYTSDLPIVPTLIVKDVKDKCSYQRPAITASILHQKMITNVCITSQVVKLLLKMHVYYINHVKSWYKVSSRNEFSSRVVGAGDCEPLAPDLVVPATCCGTDPHMVPSARVKISQHKWSSAYE